MKKISAVIIARDEEENIGRCVRSLLWADEVLVADTGSTDRTIEIAEEAGARVIRLPWQQFGPTKRDAVGQARHDWILSVDADETASPQLAEEIRNVLEKDQSTSGYHIPRRTRYLGKVIRYCGWQNDAPLRLFNRSSGNFNDRPVHEFVELTGKTGRLKNWLNHDSYRSLSDHIHKINHYTDLAAEQAFRKGKRACFWDAFMHAKFRFLRMYVLKKGFLDGINGFVLCFISAWYVFLKYMKIRELNRKGKK